MRGRPPKVRDPKLAAALRRWLANEGLSARSAAKILNVNVTTVTRALQDECFSKAFGVSVAAAIGAGKRDATEINSLQEVLLLLHEFGIMLDKAERAVRLALDRGGPTR